MSSTTSEGGGKLVVRIAENGHTYEPHCSGNTPVEVVMKYVESVENIGLHEQVVLCLEVRLDPQKLLSAYNLPSDDREIFVFNKARLHMNSPRPQPEQVENFDSAEIPLPASLHNPHPLDNAPDPALKALPSYERQFRYHFIQGDAIYKCSQKKYDTCVKFLKEQKVQERALEVASCNLDQFYKMTNQSYTEFMKHYSQQHRFHSDLLGNFGKDIEKLRSIKLPPPLQTSTRKCLLDFVKEETLRKSAENCSSSHRQFENKVSQFKQKVNEAKYKVEELFASRVSFPARDLERMIKEHQHFINEQKSILQSLSKDVNTVKKLVDECLSSQLSSSLRPHDAVSALGPMYDVHDRNHLPKMQACDREISKLLDFCRDKKNEMNLFLHNYMQQITIVTVVVKDAKLQFPVFREAMMRQDDQFMELKLLRGLGPAFRACLAEVVRRKASMKLYMGMAGQLAEKLATKREAEVQRREEFLKFYSSYIPRDVLGSLGLFDTPNQCDVNIAPFDTGLLDIDISDLDRYAPEHLVRMPLKGEKHGSLKGSFSLSNDSSHSAEPEEISVDTLEKYDSEELLEGCELVEVAGTSKMEVENAKLKADLASAIAFNCLHWPEVEYESLDDDKLDRLLKNAQEKTSEALHLKDEYVKHLQSMLGNKQTQCLSYEKRIQELEQRLSDQYLQGQKLSNNKDPTDFALLAEKVDDCKREVLGSEAHIPCISTTEPMDEVSCISNSLNAKLGLLTGQHGKAREGVDENMVDSFGMQNSQLDSSMVEPNREELLISDKDGKDKMIGQLGMSLTNSSTAESMAGPLIALPSDTQAELGLNSKVSSDLLLELQSALADKSNQLTETETKLKATLEEFSLLRRELETSRKLLDESQMNCAHLENCLHEAREEAQTHLCAADRRASEYSALRASALKMRGLFERLRSCINPPGGVAAFADSLQTLAQSLANSMNDNEDDDTADFRRCIRVLAERVSYLSRRREEHLKVEAAVEQLRKELDEKKELVKTLYTKHQLEKQANKEKISFGRLEVHEIAAFVLNSAGHYEAITRNCLNYYLSAESVALFADHIPCRPNYIVGQIVHIERQIVKSLPPTPTRPEHGRMDQAENLTSDTGTDRLTLNSGSTLNPYGLPIGCEYFLVTVAMLPDTTIHSPPPS
ncbi:autophagy-related protein 11 [Quercus robur]|uniref:autophagy-related protein 11 n=1 Tax=Quercus robur TaxID=38942 RepID=UPI00216156F1|nr:autophagy-related protein 11 [Quercus robur]